MSKTLVVYYSAQGHTKRIAEKVAENLGADIFEIVPEEIYSEADLDWTNDDARATREHDEDMRDVPLASTEVPGWENYDTVILGYPIWWGVSAWVTDAFVKAVDWNGKTVYPFCTSHSSGLGDSDILLRKQANGGDWKDGFRFFQDATDETISKWTDTLDKA